MGYPQYVKDTALGIIDMMGNQLTGFAKDPARDFTRHRKLDFKTTMLFMLTSGSGTTQHELYQYFDYDTLTPTASAFSQQRSKFKMEAFRHLAEQINYEFSCVSYLDKYQLIACDGCDFNIARDPTEESSYYPPNNKSTRGFNMVSVVPLYDILSKRYLDMEFKGGRKRNEPRALCDLVDRFMPSALSVIFMADRGFASYNVFAHMIENGMHFLIRAKDKTVERLLGTGSLGDVELDCEVTRILTRSSAKKYRDPDKEGMYRLVSRETPFDYLGSEPGDQYEISVRVVRVRLDEGSYENIITNLPSDEFDSLALKELYALRWEIELSFRDLKHTLGATEFRSGKLEFIEQELWARIILYNLCTIITSRVVIEKREGLKHVYKINFSIAAKICHKFIKVKLSRPPPDVEALIGKNLVPVRPGRKYNRQKRFRLPSSFAYRFI